MVLRRILPNYEVHLLKKKYLQIRNKLSSEYEIIWRSLTIWHVNHKYNCSRADLDNNTNKIPLIKPWAGSPAAWQYCNHLKSKKNTLDVITKSTQFLCSWMIPSTYFNIEIFQPTWYNRGLLRQRGEEGGALVRTTT